MSLISPMET
uniref:Uncharacterized protein n=1 Tax=Anguilla anguilla TaxID=7936 RepID=A0A0E9UE37_ANGAN